MRNYKFEIGDLRAFITIVNVMLIIKYGLSIAWFGLAVAVGGLIGDFIKFYRSPSEFRVNGCLMHTANIILNVYFMCCL